MDAGFDSDNSNNKSVSVKIEEIEQNHHYKFTDIEGQEPRTKRINVNDNLSRQEHKSHLTGNASDNANVTMPKSGSR